MIERYQLRELSKWAGFVGVMTIIFGAISAICGLFAFIIGAIPGIIMIVLGVKLRNAKKCADELLAAGTDGNSGTVNMLFINLNNYFKIQGVLIIIYLVLMVLGALSGALAGFAFMNMF